MRAAPALALLAMASQVDEATGFTGGPRACPMPQAAPMPPMLISDTEGTWAHDTMTRRIREEILDRIYKENDLTRGDHAGPLGSTTALLDDLEAELLAPATTPLTPVVDPNPIPDSDIEEWNQVILKKSIANGETWLSAPWLVAEFYFYRRVLAAFSGTGIDPFQTQKRAGLASCGTASASLALRLLGSVGATGRPAGAPAPTVTAAANVLRLWSLSSLWGNKLDLSLWPAPTDNNAEEPNPNPKEEEEEAEEAPAPKVHQEDLQTGAERLASVLMSGKEQLLDDNFEECWADICQDVMSNSQYSSGSNTGALVASMGIVTDNAGMELVTDMMLAHSIVAFGIAKEVTLHVKQYPVFVSDATPDDVNHTIDQFKQSSDASMQTLGQVWDAFLGAGKLKVEPHAFWCQPKPMWDMPRALAERLHKHKLVVVKGDANYRRLLGDRPWPLDTDFDEVCGYFPTRLLALRALKAEVGLGLSAEAQERAEAADPNWLTNGKFGVVQYSPGQTAGWALGSGDLHDPFDYLNS